MEPKFKLNDNQILVLVILGVIVFFVFILPVIDNNNKKDTYFHYIRSGAAIPISPKDSLRRVQA